MKMTFKKKIPKDRIIELLKDNEIRSTTQIAGTIGINNPYCLRLLECLKEEGLVKKIASPKYTYWRKKC